MSSINQKSSDITVAYGTLYDRKIIRKQGKSKNVQKLHKPQCGNTSRIKLCWTQETKLQDSREVSEEVPLCYKLNSEKEKLALWHSENFRLQIGERFPTRPPPLLAATNEYGIQKPICSFVRPSAPPFPELTEWRGIANFVSDHLEFQPLHTPTQLAVDSKGAKVSNVKYAVQSRKQFTSRYLSSMQAQEDKKIEEQLEKELEAERLRIEEEERLPPDPLHGRRVHCWVLVLPGPVQTDVVKPFYIEPASGNAFEIEDLNHMGVECVWNHLNFWFNIQTSELNVSSFDLSNSSSWLPLLNNDEKNTNNLDMPMSWMDRIQISAEEYKTRYPNGCKTVLYKRAKLELFAELSRDDGLVSKITQYADLEWTIPLSEICEYQHRQDLLQQTRLDFKEQRAVDFYAKGRIDHIKEHDYSLNEDDKKREIYFYNCSHPDGLCSLIIQPNCIMEAYEGHSECLKQRLMNFKLQENKQLVIEETVENMELLIGVPENKQVAQRKFFHIENKIFLQFHHAPGQITAGYLHFIKPNEEGKFGVEHIHEYEPLDAGQKYQETDVKSLMEKQIDAEAKVMSHAGHIHTQIQNLLDVLRKDRDDPGLKTSVFDEERNHNMVHLMKLRERELLEQAMMELVEPADPLAPLLERDDNTNAKCLTPQQLEVLKQECEKDIKDSLKRLQCNIEEEISKLKLQLEECQKQSVILADKDLEENIGLKIQALEYRLKRLDPENY